MERLRIQTWEFLKVPKVAMFFSDDWTDFSKFLTSIFSFGSIETTFKKGRWGSRCIIYLFAESEFHLGLKLLNSYKPEKVAFTIIYCEQLIYQVYVYTSCISICIYIYFIYIYK